MALEKISMSRKERDVDDRRDCRGNDGYMIS